LRTGCLRPLGYPVTPNVVHTNPLTAPLPASSVEAANAGR